MNEVFLIGKIISDIDFNFIINDKKRKSIAKFNMQTLDTQIIDVVAYNELADYIYRNYNAKKIIFVYGILIENAVLVRSIEL